MRVRGRTVAPVLRGWPPPERECRASLLVTKLDSLQLGFLSLGGVLAILWEAVRLSLDLGGGMSGVRRYWPGRSFSGSPDESALRAFRRRGFL